MLTLSDDKTALMRIATYVSVAVALTLVIIKLVAWIFTDSVSLLSSLIDSSLDFCTSLINLIAMHFALKPADEHHRFGHGKIEPLAGLLQSGFIAASAVFLLIETIKRLFNSGQIEDSGIGIIVMLVSLLVTAGLVVFQRYVIRKTDSVIVSADSLHYLTDILMNLGVVFALCFMYFGGGTWIDPLVAIMIAIYILWSVHNIAVRSLNDLLDHELPAAERDKIKQIVLSNKSVKGLHELRTRLSGTTKFIQLHLVLDGQMTLSQSHQIADSIEQKIANEFPNSQILIHQDPDNIVERVRDF